LSTAVSGAAVHRHEALLFVTLLELTVIVVAGRVGALIAGRLHQTPAVGEIVVGILLGPSLFGLLAPGTFAFVFRSAPPEAMQILSNLGLVLLMFQIGLEFDFSHLVERRNRSSVFVVASACLIVPFILGGVFGYYAAPMLSPAADQLDSALFIATAFSITALPILGRIMLDLGMTRTRLGVIAISAAAVNDVVGWLLLALISALTVSNFVPLDFALRISLVAVFGLASVFIVRPLAKRAVRASNPRDGKMSYNLLGGMLALVFVAAMSTERIGIFAAFGGFMMGVILFDETEFVNSWRVRIGNFVSVFFLPIFFTYTGLLTSVGLLSTAADWGWCALIFVLATVGKLGAAYVAARVTGFDHRQSAILGFMMNTRGLMELVVVNIGLQLGVISQKCFTMLVIMAVGSTVMTTPALRHYLGRLAVAGQRPSEEAV
jgi:Kef-type K+ transport system membrane component KefB